ncbi:hypothetical protein PROFUN_06687 [Planoprotostelium fungivorum]|uniref:Uncharacterized protein n=1 Tax=Planoprotostelium fungivorum TaxID=1890364 RepID=A0A2P6NG29_9EUKA|nr:hypothetical protein PROFUN_06687 [Planoprotostelium fungivorum]
MVTPQTNATNTRVIKEPLLLISPILSCVLVSMSSTFSADVLRRYTWLRPIPSIALGANVLWGIQILSGNRITEDDRVGKAASLCLGAWGVTQLLAPKVTYRKRLRGGPRNIMIGVLNWSLAATHGRRRKVYSH